MPDTDAVNRPSGPDRSAYLWYDLASARASALIGRYNEIAGHSGPGQPGRDAILTKIAPRIDMLLSSLVVAEAVERLTAEAEKR